MANARRRGRIRRLAKWGGVVLCALCIGGWVMNLWMRPALFIPFPGTRTLLMGIEYGRLIVGDVPSAWGRHVIETYSAGDGFHMKWWPDTRAKLGMRVLFIPLWMLFLAAALPTAYLWRRDRLARPPGDCARCGYDLSGNASGVCPECGKAARGPAPLVR